jgi:hypothetical protein
MSSLPLKAILEGDIQSVDLTKPDNLKIIWPLPRDPKIDFHVILTNLLAQNGLDRINVVTEPTFQPSLLKDKNGRWTCVIAVTRGSDSARRYGIGEQMALFINDGSGNMVDVTQTVLNAIPQGTPVEFLGQAAESTVHLDIFSINTQLSEQLYLFVKLALFAAEKPYFFSALGYIDMIRVDGRDEVSGISYEGGTHIIAARSLSYRTVTLEYAAAALNLVDVIKATFTAQEVEPGVMYATVVASPAPTLVSAGVDDASRIPLNTTLYIGPQQTVVTAITGNVLTFGPLIDIPEVGATVVGVSAAEQSADVPAQT